MTLLLPYEIKMLELELLQINAHSLADYGNETNYESEANSLENHLFFGEAKNLEVIWQNNIGKDANSNLKAFIWILLHRIYSGEVDQSLLSLVKSTLYSPTLDLQTVRGHSLQKLPNRQMKKLVVEFFYLLLYSFSNDKVGVKLKKYPIIMEVFILFIRKVLDHLRVKDALEFGCRLQTEEVYPVLCKFFRIDVEINFKVYRFLQNCTFIAENEACELHIGTYVENRIENSKTIIAREEESNDLVKVSKKLGSEVKLNAHQRTKSQEEIGFQSKEGEAKKSFAIIQSVRSFGEVKQSVIKKTMSLKDYNNFCKRYSKQTEVNKGALNYELKTQAQLQDEDCSCKGKKREKMRLNSCLYQFHLRSVRKESGSRKQSNASDYSTVSIKQSEEQYQIYVVSSGIACQLYEDRTKNQNKKRKSSFWWRRSSRTDQRTNDTKQVGKLHLEGPITKPEAKTTRKMSYRPISMIQQNVKLNYRSSNSNYTHCHSQKPSGISNHKMTWLSFPKKTTPTRSIPFLKPHLQTD